MKIVCYGYYSKKSFGDELIKDAMLTLMQHVGIKDSSVKFINGRDLLNIKTLLKILMKKRYEVMIIGGGGLFPKTTYKEVTQLSHHTERLCTLKNQYESAVWDRKNPCFLV